MLYSTRFQHVTRGGTGVVLVAIWLRCQRAQYGVISHISYHIGDDDEQQEQEQEQEEEEELRSTMTDCL